ncbi:MAG: TatD family hydrolase [Prevotella sp.]|nr:TatD family hydrolase [Prevotella sp.]
MQIIDTHIHIDGEEFDADRAEVVERAREAGVEYIFVPSIDLPSVARVLDVCRQYSGYAFPMIGLHPEEVRDDFDSVITQMEAMPMEEFIAIGEVGLDFYWSREYESQQLDAFRRQVEWACRARLPLMIHCRKAQNEMVRILRDYRDSLPGGVFHCFTGNLLEARQLLKFDNFVLGIGGVLTFKKSHLPEVVAQLPVDRIVLETDAPYMAPVPMRGKRNESAYLVHVVQRMAESLGWTPQEVAEQTTRNALRVFNLSQPHH